MIDVRDTGPVVRHLALVGATASGKSALAHRLAVETSDLEIVSVDSMQVYRGMDVGTAKPTADEQAQVRHHGIDLVGPGEEFSLAEFRRAVLAAVIDIEARSRRALLVGGTGLYLKAIVDNLDLPARFPAVCAEIEDDETALLHQRLAKADPVAAGRMEPTNRRRIVRALEVTLGSGRPFSSYGDGLADYPTSTPFALVGVWLPRGVSARRIDERVDSMIARGWVEEVRDLRKHGALSITAAQALGYRELSAHLDGAPLEGAVQEIKQRTRKFARRQRVWFRRDPRISWMGAADDPGSVFPGLVQHWLRLASTGGASTSGPATSAKAPSEQGGEQ